MGPIGQTHPGSPARDGKRRLREPAQDALRTDPPADARSARDKFRQVTTEPPGGRQLPDDPRWRDLAVPAYGPTLLVSVGQGRSLPLVALSARDLGASVGLAAFVVALIGHRSARR